MNYSCSWPKKSVVDMKVEISERIVLDAGCAFPIRQASRSRSRGETESSVVSEFIETLKRDELGVEKNVKTARQNMLEFCLGETLRQYIKLHLENFFFKFFQHEFFTSPILFVCV